MSEDLLHELEEVDEKSIEDAFYRDLGFGTGGLRGVMGVGTNRMNYIRFCEASRGLANYLGIGGSVVINYANIHRTPDMSKNHGRMLSK